MTDSLENLIQVMDPPPNANIHTNIKSCIQFQNSQKSQWTYSVSSWILGLFLLNDGSNVICFYFHISKLVVGFFKHLHFDFNYAKIWCQWNNPYYSKKKKSVWFITIVVVMLWQWIHFNFTIFSTLKVL